MTRIAVRLSQVVSGVVLVVSGVYLMVYLYRWEWNRALVAGSFFVATEVALIGSLVLRRLGAIERRLDEMDDHSTLGTVRASAAPPAPVFRWLDDGAARFQVFVPVLLGAGVILSLLAAGVERLAGVTTLPILERRLAHHLDGLQLPSGGLLGPPGGELAAPAVRHRPGRAARAATVALAVLAGSILAVTAIDVVADATQDRPDAPLQGRSEVAVAVEIRFSSRSVVGTAEALFVACRHTIGHRHQLDALEARGDGLVRILITPAIGEHATRRFVGCMEDALFDRVSADVVSVRRMA